MQLPLRTSEGCGLHAHLACKNAVRLGNGHKLLSISTDKMQGPSLQGTVYHGMRGTCAGSHGELHGSSQADDR